MILIVNQIMRNTRDNHNYPIRCALHERDQQQLLETTPRVHVYQPELTPARRRLLSLARWHHRQRPEYYSHLITNFFTPPQQRQIPASAVAIIRDNLNQTGFYAWQVPEVPAPEIFTTANETIIADDESDTVSESMPGLEEDPHWASRLWGPVLMEGAPPRGRRVVRHATMMSRRRRRR